MQKILEAFEKSWKYLVVSVTFFMVNPLYTAYVYVKDDSLLYITPVIFLIIFISKFYYSYTETK